MPRELKIKQKNVLTQLILNGRISDKEMAKRLGYSQPTVTRIRSKLEADGHIMKYCAMPDFTKLGYEIAAITAFASTRHTEGTVKQAMKWGMKNRSIVFATRGEGLEGLIH